MKLIFHGAAREVGRSCIEISADDGNRYLLDCGIKFKEDGFLLPENVLDVPDLDGVFLSHAHLDHSGGLPLFEHKDLKGPIFCTRQTLAITKILLKDSYKIERIRNIHPAYNKLDLKEVQKDANFVQFDKWYKKDNLRFMYLNAGHIPGSAMILIEIEGKRLLYTGDFNNRESELMFKAIINEELLRKPIDIIISESTYGLRDLPDRSLLQKELIETIKKTIKRGGSVLIPVFSLGRTQEILILLAKQDFGVKVYLDGMGKKITRQILSNPSKYVRNKDILSDEFYHNVEWVSSIKRRKDALRKQGIYVTTSGMMQGGPVLSYLSEMWHDEKNSVLLMGFQCKRTNGRHLIDEGFVYMDGWKTYVKCEVKKFDFSGHADKLGVQKLVSKLNPKHVFFQHGDEDSVLELKKWAEKNIKGKAYAPKISEEFIF